MPIVQIIGPPVNSMSREAATHALVNNPEFPRGAEFDIQEHAGHWIAAYVTQAGPPFDGAPADSDESSAGPKSEGPGDTAPDSGGESESSGESEGGESSGGESGPPKEKGEGGESKGHEQKEMSELSHVLQVLDAIAAALGVSLDAGLDSPVPGADAGLGGPTPPPPHGGPAGPPAPPAGPAGPAGPGGANQHVIHEKSGPPMPPTFASVDPGHPWAATVGKLAHFHVAEEIGDRDVAEVEGELQTIASAGGFRVVRAREERGEDGTRRFAAIIKTPQVSQQ